MHMANYNAKTLSISKNGDSYTYDTCAIHFGICSTAAATQTKVVSIPEIEELTTGLSIRIQFANEQAYNGTPILQLNSFEGKDIIRNGNNDSEQYEWQAGEVLDFFYDGTAWVIVEGSTPSTTYYGSRVKLSSATNSSAEDLAATPLAVKNAYDLANGKVSCTTENVKNALGTGSGTAKYLREDGTWNIPVVVGYTLPLADDGTRGGIQTGFTTDGGNRNYAVQLSNEKAYVNVPWENTTYSSKAAENGGTDLSLVTTGEKYTWNNRTHSLSISADNNGTNQLSLTANTKYKLTAGGSTFIFTTPADNSTTYESKAAVSGGTAVSLVTTGEKYIWSNSYLPLAGGNMSSGARIGSSGGTLYLGNSNNTGCVYVQDIASQSGNDKWKIQQSGIATFQYLTLNGGDLNLKTSGSSSDDCGDIIYFYGNGNEKARIWVNNSYTAKSGPNFRIYNNSGTSLYNGTLPLADGTGASGTWGISITGNCSGSSTRLDSTLIAIQTGSSKQQKISLSTLMTWLISTKGYIPSGVHCHRILETSWSYADNDILQLAINGKNYELQLAGVIIEFYGNATNYNTGVFRLRINSSPTVNFTSTSGYTQFPASHIAEYTCNGSNYSPTWKMLVDSADSISSISRSGTTFTATRPDGTSFTFTQQDNNSWRGVQTKYYSYAYTIGAGTALSLTGTNFGVSTPSGYTPRGILTFATGLDDVYVNKLDGTATGSNTVMRVTNKASASKSSTASVTILYLQN